MTTCNSCFNVTTNCSCTVQMVTVQTPTPTTVTVGAGQGGARGPQGLQGTQGIQGISGAAVNIAYVHIQGTSEATWSIVHNLNFYPNVTTMDSTGAICEGEITYTNPNSLTITFTAAFSGTAYLS